MIVSNLFAHNLESWLVLGWTATIQLSLLSIVTLAFITLYSIDAETRLSLQGPSVCSTANGVVMILIIAILSGPHPICALVNVGSVYITSLTASKALSSIARAMAFDKRRHPELK